MPTSKSEVLDSFHTEFMSDTVLPEGLENEFFMKALGDFELDLYELNYDKTSETFADTLKRPVITTLGSLMYVHYTKREKDRILKLQNIVGKDIQVNSMGVNKQTALENYKTAKEDADDYIHKIKESTF